MGREGEKEHRERSSLLAPTDSSPQNRSFFPPLSQALNLTLTSRPPSVIGSSRLTAVAVPAGMDPTPTSDYWIDDVGLGSDGELRCVLESFCDMPLADGSAGFREGYEDGCSVDQSCSRKRGRDDACRVPKSKACREKLRRDKLNDRFLELSSVLDSGRPPRSDKASILSDAARLLIQLKTEAEQLKESNEKLQETIKELKVEKNELRDEKMRLKTDKERLEQQIKAMSAPPPAAFMPHPMALHPAAAAARASFAAHAQAQSVSKKGVSFGAYPAMPMWQWLPPAVLDTTQDAKLWPPHA